MKVIFSHGKESGPWGSKIKRLADVAKAHGLGVESIDYSDTFDPDLRVERLLKVLAGEKDRCRRRVSIGAGAVYSWLSTAAL